MSEDGWEATPDMEDPEVDADADADTDSGSSYFGSEFEDEMYFTMARHHHRHAESDGNSSDTDFESDDGYYGAGWRGPDNDENKENAEIPEPPRFTKFKNPYPRHTDSVRNLPEGFGDGDFRNSLKVFQLFVTDASLTELATATNAYAVTRQARNVQWKPTTAGELKVFFGTILYMGIFRASGVGDYWRNDWMGPRYPMKIYIRESRFRELLEFFHTGTPDFDDDEDWRGQLEPFGERIREASMRYYLPGVEMSLDRTKDLNIFSLKHYSYTWNFLFHKDPPSNVLVDNLGVDELSFPVSTSAYLLASSLPKETRRFTIIANKHFTNVPLFSVLRKIGIGAVGEATWNRVGFPESLQKLEGKYIPWGTVTGAVCGPDNDVLAIVWRHFATVRMLTTMHEITPVNRKNYGKSDSYKSRCPPRDKPIVDAAFGRKNNAMIEQPRAALEHSDYAESTQHLFTKTPRDMFWTRQLSKEPVVHRRAWLMGLVWLLDVAVVNANVVARRCGVRKDHTRFRIEVATELLKGQGPRDPSTLSDSSSNDGDDVDDDDDDDDDEGEMLGRPLSLDYSSMYQQGNPSTKNAKAV